MPRTLEVGGNQGKGNPPAFNTRLHRCTSEDSPCGTPETSMGRAYAFWAVALVLAGCAIVAIVVFNLPKGVGP